MTLQRRYFRGLPVSRPLCFEGLMLEPARQLSAMLARWASLALVVLGTALCISGAPAMAQTLTEALSYAYNNNPQLLAQRALLRATDEQVPQALSGWRPTVNFTGQAGEERAGFQTVGPTQFSSFTARQLDLKITQPVYNGGRTEAQTKQAVNTVESTRAQTLAVETTVFQAVVQAFFDTYRDQALVEVNRN
ncbi:MAG TPA: TolC family protein, partial [Stellaceae bacterium]|nr:TolC family protein [Stellaceae bacterium]